MLMIASKMEDCSKMLQIACQMEEFSLQLLCWSMSFCPIFIHTPYSLFIGPYCWWLIYLYIPIVDGQKQASWKFIHHPIRITIAVGFIQPFLLVKDVIHINLFAYTISQSTYYHRYKYTSTIINPSNFQIRWILNINTLPPDSAFSDTHRGHSLRQSSLIYKHICVIIYYIYIIKCNYIYISIYIYIYIYYRI